MPLYEYLCDACGNRFEKIVQFSDPPLEVCPKCGGKVQKLFSSPAIQFKGSGFYITDYARKSSSEAAGGKSSDKSAADTASSDKASSDKSSSEKSSDKGSDSGKSDKSSAAPASTASTTTKE
jgi:putative FmdB family regulatory protein